MLVGSSPQRGAVARACTFYRWRPRPGHVRGRFSQRRRFRAPVRQHHPRRGGGGHAQGSALKTMVFRVRHRELNMGNSKPLRRAVWARWHGRERQHSNDCLGNPVYGVPETVVGKLAFPSVPSARPERAPEGGAARNLTLKLPMFSSRRCFLGVRMPETTDPACTSWESAHKQPSCTSNPLRCPCPGGVAYTQGGGSNRSPDGRDLSPDAGITIPGALPMAERALPMAERALPVAEVALPMAEVALPESDFSSGERILPSGERFLAS
eukprot:gene13249-biopygen12546